MNELGHILQPYFFSPPLFRVVLGEEDIVKSCKYFLQWIIQWAGAVNEDPPLFGTLASSGLQKGSGLTDEKSPKLASDISHSNHYIAILNTM